MEVAMFKVIVCVLLAVVLMGYGAFFITWNMDVVHITGFELGETAYGTDMPVSFLALAGVVVGVLIMAIAAWSTWAGQRHAAMEARARLELAKKKLGERTDMVRVLREDVASLRAALNASAGAPETDVTADDAGAEDDGAEKPDAIELSVDDIEDDEVIT
jgi:hypothetical protein